MAVTEGKIAAGNTGKNLDTTIVTQTDAGTAHREVVTIGDPEKLAAYANVSNKPNPAAIRLGVSDQESTIILGELLADMLEEQRKTNFLLEILIR